MLLSMLWFESKQDNANKQQLEKLKNRIKSMSMLHESLYNSKDLSNINIKEYLNKIIYNISNSNKNLVLERKIEDISIDFDNAVSLGIIINEVFTNSIKHNNHINHLIVDIDITQKENRIYLSIKDNGKGFDENNKKRLGFKLINQFANKLINCKYNFSFENGTMFALEFDKRIKSAK